MIDFEIPGCGAIDALIFKLAQLRLEAEAACLGARDASSRMMEAVTVASEGLARIRLELFVLADAAARKATRSETAKNA